MGLLGNIWVKLGLDNSDFKKGLKESEGQTNKFQAGLKSIGTTMAAAFSVAAITSFFKKAVEGYNAEALAVAKLDAVLKATGGTIGLTTNELVKYATQLEKISTFEDDVTINAMAMAMTFQSIKGDNFKRMIASAQDLATVMGSDLQGSVRQLGVALESPVLGMQRLRRAGIIFSDEQTANVKKLVEGGKLYEAQLIVLAAVQAKVGGAALAAAQTAGGAWLQTKNAIANFMEEIGSGIEKTKGLAQNLTAIIYFITSMAKADVGPVKFTKALLGNKNALNEITSSLEQQGIRQKEINAYVEKNMALIKTKEDAEKRLITLQGLTGGSYDVLRASLQAYISEQVKGDEIASQTEIDRLAALKKEQDALGYGLIPNLERLVKIEQERLKNADNTKILANGQTELQNIIDRTDRLTTYIANLKKVSDIKIQPVNISVISDKLPKEANRVVNVVTNTKENIITGRIEKNKPSETEINTITSEIAKIEELDNTYKNSTKNFISLSELKGMAIDNFLNTIKAESDYSIESESLRAKNIISTKDIILNETIPAIEELIKVEQDRLESADNTIILENGKTELQIINDKIEQTIRYKNLLSSITEIKPVFSEKQYDPILSNENYKKWLEERKKLTLEAQKNSQDAVDAINTQGVQLEISGEQMASAISNSIGGAVDELVTSLMETGEVDTSSIVKALIQPLLGMVSQLGEVLIATGIGMIALQTSIKDPYTLIIAGAAMVALSAAAGAAMNSLVNNTTSSGQGNATSFTGGYGGFNTASAVGGQMTPALNISGVLKGEDIYLSVQKTEAKRAR